MVNDSYSVSQTQTINFTQQTLRQRQAQPQTNQQTPQSQSQQQSQLGMQMNMAAQNSGSLITKLNLKWHNFTLQNILRSGFFFISLLL